MKIFLLLLTLNCLASCINNSKPSEPVTVEAPVPDINKTDKSDSTYLKIGMLKKGYELSILDKYLKTDNTDSIDQFITANSSIINKQKIVLQEVDSDSDGVAKLLPILRKNRIFRFTKETTQ